MALQRILHGVSLEDYEYDVFHYRSNTVDFEIGIELLVKMIKPDSSDTVFVDGIVEFEEGVYITDFNGQKVFGRQREDYEQRNGITEYNEQLQTIRDHTRYDK